METTRTLRIKTPDYSKAIVFVSINENITIESIIELQNTLTRHNKCLDILAPLVTYKSNQ